MNRDDRMVAARNPQVPMIKLLTRSLKLPNDHGMATVGRFTIQTLAISMLVQSSIAQSPLYTFDGDSPGDNFGHSVSGAGDVNADGFDDVIVGIAGDDNNGQGSGSARVFSGKDGSILHTFHGDAEADLLGFSVSGAGDVNSDGYDDLICGAPGGGSGSGSARVFSGLDGSVLHNFVGDSLGDYFGWSVSGAGDVNGDGFADLIVGAWADDDNGTSSGSARIFSGRDGSVFYTLRGSSSGDYFGWSVSGAGDVDGDGLHDLIVGARLEDSNAYFSGSAYVFSGLDGSVLYTFDGDSEDDQFGWSVSGAGDVNRDGFADLVVGARLDDNNGADSGSARVFSGVDGSVLYTIDGASPGDSFGYSVSDAGDVNGDGLDDIIVGVNLAGNARVLSGLDGSLFYYFRGDSKYDWFGWSVSGAGDVNGDGHADLIVGAFGDDNNGADSGSARVFSGCDFHGPIGQNYCGPANLNSTGQSAVISAVGSTIASDNAVTLTAGQLPPNVFGYFLNSDVQDFKPFPPGSKGNLCLGGGIGRHVKQVGNTGAAGELVIDLDLTALPRPNGTHSVVAGETWNFQCWFRDKVGGPTSNFTDGVSVLFQ